MVGAGGGRSLDCERRTVGFATQSQSVPCCFPLELPASALLPLPVPITILPLPTPRMASGVDSKPEVHSAGSLGLPRRQSYWPDALTSTIVRLIQRFLQTWVQEEKSCEGFHQQSPLL